MTLLVGTESIFPDATHEVNWAVGFAGGAQFTASASGTLTDIFFHTAELTASTCTTLGLGIYAEGSGKPTGAPLSSKEEAKKPATNAWVHYTGLSASVTSGTKYWLTWLPVGGFVAIAFGAASGGTTVIESSAGGKSKLSELTTEGAWGGTAAVGPASTYGTSASTPGGAVAINAGALIAVQSRGSRRRMGMLI